MALPEVVSFLEEWKQETVKDAIEVAAFRNSAEFVGMMQSLEEAKNKNRVLRDRVTQEASLLSYSEEMINSIIKYSRLRNTIARRTALVERLESLSRGAATLSGEVKTSLIEAVTSFIEWLHSSETEGVFSILSKMKEIRDSLREEVKFLSQKLRESRIEESEIIIRIATIQEEGVRIEEEAIISQKYLEETEVVRDILRSYTAAILPLDFYLNSSFHQYPEEIYTLSEIIAEHLSYFDVGEVSLEDKAILKVRALSFREKSLALHRCVQVVDSGNVVLTFLCDRLISVAEKVITILE